MKRCQGQRFRLHRSHWHLRFIFVVTLSYLCLIDGCVSFVIQPKSWDYKGHHIAYDEARQTRQVETEKTESRQTENPILLLNGFGVGSFHQHRLIPNLFKHDESRVVYAIDYLGQGKSWPKDCDDGNSANERGLIYSADTWLDQITQFIEDVILPQHDGRPVHVVGNSVGGYLAAILAARRPDLVETICLLNATPVWGLNLPGWSGHLPPPAIPRRIGRYMFDWIRDLGTIEKYLVNAYATRDAFGEELMTDIRSCTEGKGGHAAFASILWSPPAKYPSEKKTDFFDNLLLVRCDTLLLFGKDDPWCKPAFAKKMIQALSRRNYEHEPVCRYVEVTPVGHCPGHEAPTAVGKVISAWVAASKRGKSDLVLVQGPKEVFHEAWAEIEMEEKEESDIPLSFLDRLATTFVG